VGGARQIKALQSWKCVEKLQCNLLYAFDPAIRADVVFLAFRVVAGTAEMLNICYCSLMFPVLLKTTAGEF